MLALALAAGTAWSYSFHTSDYGHPASWEVMPQPFAVNAELRPDVDDAALASLVAGAGRAWEDVEGADGIAFTYDGTTSTDVTEYDGENVVLFLEDDEWEGEPDEVARTSIWVEGDGTILEFDIALRAEEDWSLGSDPDRVDLLNTLTHELGHAVGLDHSDVGEATMFSSTEAGDVSRRTLAIDDMNGLARLYEGRDLARSAACSTGRAGASFLPLPAALVAVVGRRRK